jgi:polyhydroxybutyrate depolymerase
MKKIVQIVIISFVLFCNVGVQGFLIVDAEKTNQYLGGDFLRFIIVDGLLRSYQIHIPEGYNNDASVPIMFILHGITGSAQQVKLMSKMNEKSDEEEFIVVYPNGHINKQFFRTIFSPFVWNEWVVHDDVDDANFLHILIEKLQIDYNINSSRIYLCGISGGASMTYKLEDNLVPFDGGWAQGIFWKSVNESVAFWVEHNKCNITPLIESIGSGNVIKEIYENGTDDSEVVLFILKNSGHEWFGSPIFPPCDISATDLIWEFFEAHPKQ